MHRRRALQLGGAAALVGLGGALVRSRRDPPPSSGDVFSVRDVPLDRAAIVERLRLTATRDISAVSAELLARSTSPDALLGALVAAPLLTGSDVGDVHSVLAIEPVRRAITTPGLSVEDRRLAVMWAAANSAEWLRDDAPPEPAPGIAPANVEAAGAAIIARIAERDAARADRAVIECLRLGGLGTTTRALALAGLDSTTDPHRLIYLEQAVRAIEHLAIEPALVLRSVARYMARTALPSPIGEQRPPAIGRAAPTFAAPTHAATNVADPQTTRWLLDGLASDPTLIERTDPPAEPAWHALSVWALRALRATPDVSGAAVHGVSLLHAAIGAYDRAADDAERRFILGRAGRWLVNLAPSGAEGSSPSPQPGPDINRVMGAVARAGSDAHDFKVTVALTDLGARLPVRWHGELTAALAASRVQRAPSPWPGRAAARDALRAAFAGADR